jgi:hypothetical protein
MHIVGVQSFDHYFISWSSETRQQFHDDHVATATNWTYAHEFFVLVMVIQIPRLLWGTLFPLSILAKKVAIDRAETIEDIYRP